ncbi:MAG: phosphodiester glycosidase family protein [Anaerolineae bacterium]|nr:phosphodiester glycosidase family protein [Anaerolineae bacterium]
MNWLLRRVWLLLLAGCSSSALPSSLPTTLPVTPPSTPAVVSATPAPTATLPPLDSGWQELKPGLEQRTLNIVDDERVWQETVTVLRVDPAFYTFGVAYRPGAPLQLPQWQAETGALLVVNGGFYTEEYLATGLIISNGVASGSSYAGFGGMFAVGPAGPQVRSLVATPYDPAEPLQAALQSFPLLLKPGGVVGFPEEDGQQARRTVVAQDRDGRVLFLVANRGAFTLHTLSLYLAHSDLALDVALNLDGGPSSGMMLMGAGEQPVLHLPAFALLPAVITVQPREPE